MTILPVATPPATRSPAHQVTFTEGADDVLAAIRDHLALVVQPALSGTNAESYEDLAEQRKQVIEQLMTYVNGLTSVLTACGDGDARISYDGPLSLFWSYASGYHGGLLHHVGRTPASSRWSIHS